MIRLEAWRSIRQGIIQVVQRVVSGALLVGLLVRLLLPTCRNAAKNVASYSWLLDAEQRPSTPPLETIMMLLLPASLGLWLVTGSDNAKIKALPLSRSNATKTCTLMTGATQRQQHSSTTGKNHALPATQLSFLSLPTDILVQVCACLHPRDVTMLTTVNKAAHEQFCHNAIWKRLWYRDYGTTLLQWSVGRDVMAASLTALGATNDATITALSLEERVSQRLDQLAQEQSVAFLREFYFIFGEVYLSYLLARRNQATHCYVGLHGHVLDFTPFLPYHPGLDTADTIFVECGADATAYFEQLPHSTGARAVARQLAVIINKGCLRDSNDNTNNNNSTNHHQCGLVLRTLPSDLQRLLQWSNSWPLQNHEGSSSSNNINMMLHQLLPGRRRNSTRRPPTLHRIRQSWDVQQEFQEAKLLASKQQHDYARSFSRWVRRTTGVSSALENNDTYWRIYFDPLQQVWVPWNARDTLT